MPNPSSPAPSRSPAVATRAQMLVVWCMLSVAFVAAALASALVPSDAAANAGLVLPFRVVVTALVVCELAALPIVLRSVARKTAAGDPDTRAAQQTIIAAALAFGPGLFVSIAHWLTRDGLLLVLLLPLAVVLLWCCPTEARWARLGAGAGRSNPLVRG